MDPVTQGYCNAGVCDSIKCDAYKRNAAGLVLLDRFCGASSSNPCKAQCGPSDSNKCVDTSTFLFRGYSLSNGAICTKHGNKGVCISGVCEATTSTTTSIITSGCASWNEESNQHCSGNTLPTPYFNLVQAQNACAKLGSSCAGIYDFGCNSSGGYLLCKPGDFRSSSSGSCVCTPPVEAANGPSVAISKLSGLTVASPGPNEIAETMMPAKITVTHTTTSSVCGSWRQVSNRHCSDNSLLTVYSTLIQAQRMCTHLGANCGGIYNFGCDGGSGFLLCKPGGFRPSSSGSCVCAPQASAMNAVPAITTASVTASIKNARPQGVCTHFISW